MDKKREARLYEAGTVALALLILIGLIALIQQGEKDQKT